MSEDMIDACYLVLSLTLADSVNGFALVIFHSDHVSEFEKIAVDERFRRLGIGRALVSKVCELADKSRGSLRLEVAAANLAARELYGEFFFQTTGKPVSDDGKVLEMKREALSFRAYVNKVRNDKSSSGRSNLGLLLRPEARQMRVLKGTITDIPYICGISTEATVEPWHDGARRGRQDAVDFAGGIQQGTVVRWGTHLLLFVACSAPLSSQYLSNFSQRVLSKQATQGPKVSGMAAFLAASESDTGTAFVFSDLHPDHLIVIPLNVLECVPDNAPIWMKSKSVELKRDWATNEKGIIVVLNNIKSVDSQIVFPPEVKSWISALAAESQSSSPAAASGANLSGDRLNLADAYDGKSGFEGRRLRSPPARTGSQPLAAKNPRARTPPQYRTPLCALNCNAYSRRGFSRSSDLHR